MQDEAELQLRQLVGHFAQMPELGRKYPLTHTEHNTTLEELVQVVQLFWNLEQATQVVGVDVVLRKVLLEQTQVMPTGVKLLETHWVQLVDVQALQ